MANLNELASVIHNNARAKGFYDAPFNTAEKLMLIVSELSEALERDREPGNAAPVPNLMLDAVDSWGDPIKFAMHFKTNIKDTFGDEMADAIIRILDLCAAKNINIDRHIKLKMRYNATRPHMHGKKY